MCWVLAGSAAGRRKQTVVDHRQRPQQEPPRALPSSSASWQHHICFSWLAGDRECQLSLSAPLGSLKFDHKRTGVLPQSGGSQPFIDRLGSVQLPHPEPLYKNPCWRPKLLSSPVALNL